LIAYSIIVIAKVSTLFLTILISTSIYLVFITIKDFFLKNQKNISQKISHFGFSLLILSIILNGILSDEVITNMKVGENFKYNKGKIYFEKVSTEKRENYTSLIGFFKIKENNNEIFFEPELRIFNQPTTITSEADIKISLIEDKFLVINLVKGNEYFNVRYQKKPFMIWIWLSATLMGFGSIINFFRKNKHEW